MKAARSVVSPVFYSTSLAGAIEEGLFNARARAEPFSIQHRARSSPPPRLSCAAAVLVAVRERLAA